MFDIFKKAKNETYQEYDKRMYDIASKNSKYITKDGEIKDYSDFARAKATGVVQARKDERRRIAYKKAKAEGKPWLSSSDYKSCKPSIPLLPAGLVEKVPRRKKRGN